MSVPIGKTADKVPTAAVWLGGLGAIPFLSLATIAGLADDAIRPTAIFALVAYGAVILSFLGGIRWGLAMADLKSELHDEALLRRLIWSVVPSLTAWLALLLSTPANLLVLALAFVVWLFIDLRVVAQSAAPAWYPKLRVPLTIAAVTSLLIGAVT